MPALLSLLTFMVWKLCKNGCACLSVCVCVLRTEVALNI